MTPEQHQLFEAAAGAVGPGMIGASVATMVRALTDLGASPDEIGDLFAGYTRFLVKTWESAEAARLVSAGDQLRSAAQDTIDGFGDEEGP